MTKKSKLSDADKAVFKDAMKDVNPLTYVKTNTSKPPALPIIKRKPTLQNEDSALFQFSDYEIYPPVGCDDLIQFARSGVPHKVLRQMRTGQYYVEAKLDLHGLVVTEARESLARFLLECNHKKIRQVLIIHGKGRAHHHPILKNKLNHWLRQQNDILAFCSAQAKEGGTGALYVLLKTGNALKKEARTK